MQSTYFQFLRNLLIFSALLGLIIWGISFIIPAQYLSPTLPFQFVFFLALTILVYYFLMRAAQERFHKFLNTFLVTTSIKLLFFLAIISVYLFLNRKDAAPFTISFFILYLCFSTFEVVVLVAFLKKFKQ